MKRYFLLFALLLLCFAGCHQTPDTPQAPPEEEMTVSAPEELTKLAGVASVTAVELEESYKALAYDVMLRVEELNIHVQLVLPADYVTKSCPIALYLPDVRTDSRDLATRFAAKGIIVAKLSSRGSNGLSEGKKDMGGQDYADIKQLLNVLSEADFLSASNFVLVGASEGTIRCLKLAAEGHPRVTACVLTGTMSDLTAMYQAGLAQAYFKGTLGGTPEEVPEAYTSRSAVTFADQIAVPVLMVHSKGMEASFPVAQARALEDALIAAGNDKSMVIEVDGAFTDFHNSQALNLMWAWIQEYH